MITAQYVTGNTNRLLLSPTQSRLLKSTCAAKARRSWTGTASNFSRTERASTIWSSTSDLNPTHAGS